MGKICYHLTTGVVKAWVRQGPLPAYDPATHAEMESDSPPPAGMRWDGAAWAPLPPKTDAEKDTELAEHLASVGGKLDKMFATVLIQKGICTMAELRTIYRGL